MCLNDDIGKRKEFGAIRHEAGSMLLIGGVMKASLFASATLHHHLEANLGQGGQNRRYESDPALF
jgi:hypothetical protein